MPARPLAPRERALATGKPGAVTRRIQDLFFGLFEGRTPDKHGWLEAL
jgi:branched-chain amino acid aminotransferase